MHIQKNISLSQYTTFKTGGPAEYFCEIDTKEDLLKCFNWIKLNKTAFFCLGNGSNLVINDLGFPGTVLKMNNIASVWDKNKSTSGAGTPLAVLINEAKRHGLGGMEWGFGIPATLGGAVRNNAGAFGSDISKTLVSVEIFDTEKAEFRIIQNKDCDFSYHKSIFQTKPTWLIWQASLVWEEREEKEIEENIQKYLNQRKEKQPIESPSAGSYFQNPLLSNMDEKKREQIVEDFVKRALPNTLDGERDRLSEEIRKKVSQSGVLPAAYLIEETGLKGRSIGGAQVSEKHANFIINTGQAKTEDIIILSSIIKQKVRTKFGIQLHEEVEYVGF